MKRRTKIILWSLAFFGPIWWIYPVGLLGGKTTLSPETTRITSPLKANGVPDYAAWHNARDGEGVTEENNAAVVLAPGWMEDGDVLRRLKAAPPAKVAEPLWFDEWAKAFKASLRGPALREAEDFDKAVRAEEGEGCFPWTAEAHPDLAAWLRAHQPLIDRALVASRRERFFVPRQEGVRLLDQSMPWLGEIRRDTQFLRFHAMQCAGEGRIPEALEQVRAMRRLGRLVGTGDSSLMAGMVGCGVEHASREVLMQIMLVLPKDHPSQAEIERMVQEPALDPEAIVARALGEQERDQALEVVQEFFLNEQFSEGPLIQRTFFRTVQDQVDMDQALRHIHRRFDAVARHEKMPESKGAQDVFAAAILFPPGFRTPRMSDGLGAMVGWIVSLSGSLEDFALRQRLQRELMPVIAALGNYRIDHHGVFPPDLAALVPAYFPELPKLETTNEVWVYETADSGKAFGLVRVVHGKKDVYVRRPLDCPVMFGSPGFEKARGEE